MANYYHEARAHVRSLKTLETDNKRRAERRAEVANAHAEHPLNLLVIDGRQVKLYKGSEQHAAAERGEGLITWSEDPDATIDRFDGRALLDMYRDFDPETAPRKATSPEEERLAKLLAFESFRDLVRLSARGLGEREGLAAATAENIEIRAAAKATAVSMYAAGTQPQPLPCTTSAAAAGQGAYAAVGFSYGSGASGPAGAGDSSSSSDEDEEEADVGEGEEEGGGEEAEAERQDELAFARFGIEDFSYRLHRALEQEGEQAEAMGRRPRRRHGKKKAKERARRMKGQGLSAHDWRDPGNASSAAAGQRGGKAFVHIRTSSRSRSRSRSPEGGVGGGGAGGRGPALSLLMQASRPAAGHMGGLMREAFQRDDNVFESPVDAPDPARASNQARLTQLMMMHEAKQAKQADEERNEERERERGRGGGGGRRSRSRSRTRGRERGYVRGRGRSRSRSRSRERRRRGSRSRSRRERSSRSRSRSRSRGRRHRSRSRSRDRGRGRGREEQNGGSRPGPAGAAAPAGGAATGAGSLAPAPAPAPAAAPKAETPQERLKRIMATQLTKQAQKDLTVSHMKRIQVEKEKHARATLDKAVQPRH